jgi:1,4-dihydroxy-6-naphthoate synthase
MVNVTVACSPDADDLFMMRALLDGAIDTEDVAFTIETVDTDALNRLASGEGADVSAISMAWYPRIASHYLLLPHGGSVGEGYGPVVVAPQPKTLGDLRGLRVAVPGLTTTAYAVLRSLLDFEPVVTPITPYTRIFEALRAGEVDAGLIIHEGRLTYEDEGFHRVIDLGEAWSAATGGLPLPLGANAIHRRLGSARIAQVSRLLRASIAHALDHREAAIDWLLARGGALRTRALVDRYLSMYANARTLDYGPDGRHAVGVLLRRLGWDGEPEFSP